MLFLFNFSTAFFLGFFSVFLDFFFIICILFFCRTVSLLFNQQLTLPLVLQHATLPAQGNLLILPAPSPPPCRCTSDSCTSVEHIIPCWPKRKSCADSTCILYVDLLHLYISSYYPYFFVSSLLLELAHSFEITAWHRFQKEFANWAS